jgi:anion-transporting  ArsA/GET3 family ATPase
LDPACPTKPLDSYPPLHARVESILGANLVRQVLDFYSLFLSIAEGYAERAQKTVALLKDPTVTEFRVVTTPQKAMRDAQFFHEALSSRRFPIGSLYVNRVWELERGAEYQEGLEQRLMDWYGSVRASHAAAVAEVRAAYGASIPYIASLPELEQKMAIL